MIYLITPWSSVLCCLKSSERNMLVCSKQSECFSFLILLIILLLGTNMVTGHFFLLFCFRIAWIDILESNLAFAFWPVQMVSHNKMSTDKIFTIEAFSLWEKRKSRNVRVWGLIGLICGVVLLSETLRALRFCLLSNVNGITCHRQNFPFDVEE